MSGLAVYAVIYPAALRFLAPFWASLSPQLPGVDAVYLSLDGVAPDTVRAVTGKHPTVRLLQAAPGASPATIRSNALAHLAHADDILLPGRLSAAAAALESADVYGSAMQVVDELGEPVGGAVFAPTPSQVESIGSGTTLLARVNVFGFSNSAYRAATLLDCLPVPDDTVMMDWLVASRAYLAGATPAFDLRPRMLYRQYGENTAGVLPPFGSERVVRDAGRVAVHHAKLLGGPHGTARSPSPFVSAKELSHGFRAWLADGPADGEGPTRPREYATKLARVERPVWLWWEHVAAQERNGDYEPSHCV